MSFNKNNHLKNCPSPFFPTTYFLKSYILHITTLILVILFFISINVSAQTAGRVINFQGRLTDQKGNPLNGTYDIIFSIYSSDPNMAPLWTESHTEVNISNGVVNVLLGSKKSLDEQPKVTFDQERYLGITIDCDHDPNTKEPEMSPRQLILPALYSYNADRLDGKDSSEFTTPQTDAGRPGVAEHLYEGSTRLVDKYTKKEELDWNQLKNIPSGFADGTDHVNDGVSNPSGTYNSMSVGYASSAGSAGNASAVNGLQFSPLRMCHGVGLKNVEGHERSTAVWPSNWSISACKNVVCNGHWNIWELYEFYSNGTFKLIDRGICP